MTYRLVFRTIARREFRDAVEWYERRATGLGLRFASAVDREITSMLANPLRHPCWHGEFRRVVLKVFPYAIHFRVEGELVIVLAVYHGKRNPDALKRRR